METARWLGPESIYWNWESGIRDNLGDVDTMRMF